MTSEIVVSEGKKPKVRIVAFADEYSRNADEHLKYFGERNIPISIRSFSFDDKAKLDDLGTLAGKEFMDREGELKKDGIVKNMLEASDEELKEYHRLMDEHGVEAWDTGSPLGKQYIGEPDFANSFFGTLAKTIRVAKFFGTRLIRSFTLYPGTEKQVKAENADLKTLWDDDGERAKHLNDDYQNILRDVDLEPILEVEASLFGHDAESLKHFGEGAFMYFDGGNMVQQITDDKDLPHKTFTGMSKYLAGVHVKDMKYIEKSSEKRGAVKEDDLWPYVPVGEGDAQYKEIFADLKEMIPGIQLRLKNLGLKPEVAVVLEPHLICGGQFGGFTGRKMDDALKALTGMLDQAGIGYQDVSVQHR